MFPMQNQPNSRSGAINFGNIGQTFRNIDAGFNNWVDKTDFLPGISVKGGVRSPVNNAWIGKTATAPQQGGGTGGGNTGGNTGDSSTAQNDYTPIYGSAGYTGSTSGTPYQAPGDPNEVAYWNDQMSNINRLLGNVDTTKGQGLSRIDSAYNDSVSSTNDAQSKTLRNYGIQEQETSKAKVGALNKVDAGARTGYENLQRILGLAGAGRSAVAQELVPWAVSKEATGERSGVVDTFGTNLRNIDIGKKDAEEQYRNVLADLAKQKRTQTEDFERGIETTRQSYQQNLLDAANKKAMAGGQSYQQAAAARNPFQQQISQTQSTLDGLFNKYSNTTLNARPVNVQKVNLQDYQVDPARLSGGQTQGYTSDVSQYLPWLQDDEENNTRKLA